jgi:16S rRNA (cytosine1402-N4)-methyltransferase
VSGGNRYAPQANEEPAQFQQVTRKAIGPDDQELEENPRSRSAKLRVGIRTEAPAGVTDYKKLGMPMLAKGKR